MNSSFLMALGRHDGGALVENADELLKDCVKEVTRYGGKATVTITLTVSPNGETGNRALKLSATAKATLPKRAQGEAFYWAGEDDELLRNPPKDHDLFEGPRAVNSDDSTPRY